jgi:hypothetical protein
MSQSIVALAPAPATVNVYDAEGKLVRRFGPRQGAVEVEVVLGLVKGQDVATDDCLALLGHNLRQERLQAVLACRARPARLMSSGITYSNCSSFEVRFSDRK